MNLENELGEDAVGGVLAVADSAPPSIQKPRSKFNVFNTFNGFKNNLHSIAITASRTFNPSKETNEIIRQELLAVQARAQAAESSTHKIRSRSADNLLNIDKLFMPTCFCSSNYQPSGWCFLFPSPSIFTVYKDISII
jgi:hypothetical protein